MVEAIGRRRAICIMAAAAGLPLLPFAGSAEAGIEPVVWRGQALGAPATLILNIDDKVLARRLINRVVAEVARLESIFSLYKDGSTLRELNKVGALASPPFEMVALLEACRSVWDASGGAFDPTIQPLWMLYAQHFSSPGADPAGPERQALDAVLSRVGFDGVRFNRDRIAFARPEMALSFNGIAQGYVTDRIVDLLREAGMTSSLVNMGENRAIGAQADGRPWRIGLAEMETGSAPDTILEIVNKAVSTSSASGFHFDPAARFGHILDPRRGNVPPLYRRMSVIAPDATTADAMSTAFSLMKPEAIQSFLQLHPEIAVDMVAG
ncbi:FAD:protein FMN transferase [Agrobacterium sp. a22-2]|uniref:FAD:protein FMN transferase n=1 Tax=Agrobacterium sp. a22-2 TaxID=2283840 RepID=UPI001448238B|nr:FAD:protein FMN transferase [Agrobacterium sp. a22-2]NKN37552.1 FAD:protein FMN transferase [Agrobacterium sp. a22-2]